MIKHGKIFPVSGTRIPRSYLRPIAHLITRGIADLRGEIVLHPQHCDVRGSKRKNPQMCFMAKDLKRELKCDAAVVGVNFAYVLFDGLAIRMQTSHADRPRIVEFDTKGRAHLAPFKFRQPQPSWVLGHKQRGPNKSIARGGPKRPRVKNLDVRKAGV